MRRSAYRDFDKVLFLAPLAIFVIGIASIYSASFKSGQAFDDSLALRQILWMGVAVLLCFLVVRGDYFRLHDLAVPLYSISLVLLVVVLFMPARLGAHRWIGVGSFGFQPSEIAKLSVILMLARHFADHRAEYAFGLDRWKPFLIVLPPFLLILKEPDLGTGLLLLPVLFSMLYLWGFGAKRLLGLALAGAALAPVGFFFLRDYQKSRLAVFMNPNADPLGAGYTIIQSKIAIGSGGLFGKGFLGGTQNRLAFLPERHTDFIFGVVAEEGGLLAGGLLIALFGVIAWKGFSISSKTGDRFGSQLACGLTTLLSVQAIINLGMTMGVLPVVGVPLPLVSYGGTSLLMTMLSIAILINIKMRRPLF
jgi:rod shape determining protein RodA